MRGNYSFARGTEVKTEVVVSHLFRLGRPGCVLLQ